MSESQKPVSVLFVCLGNICRSPMAEGVFRHLTAHPTNPSSSSASSTPHPLISQIDSCGTGAYHVGDTPDPRTLSTLKAHSIPPRAYTSLARKLSPSDFKTFDYLFAMDSSNLSNMQAARQRAIKQGIVGEEEAGKVMLFGAFGGKKGGREEVEDPYYGGDGGFEDAFEQVDRFSRGFINYLEGGRK